MKNPFRYFKTSPEIIRLAVMMYVRFPLSLRNVEDLLHERGIGVSHETIRFWWNRFGPIFAAEIRKKRMDRMRAFSGWRWHLDEMFVKINGEGHYLWRAVDQEGEVLEAFVSKKRDREAALKFLRKLMKRYGRPDAIITDRLRSYRAALRELGGSGLQQAGRWLNNRAENSHLPFRRREHVAVGTILSDRPPHRSQRAELPHWALTSGNNAQSLFGIRVYNSQCRKPSCR